MANNSTANLSDLTPDDRNANKGTQRGTGVIEDSLRKYGAGRSILIDRNGRIISGNKTAEAAASIGLENVRIIETDGHEIVAVTRTDLDLDSIDAVELAIQLQNITGKRVKAEQFKEVRTVQDVVDTVHKMLQEM